MREYIFSFETQDGLEINAPQGKIYENPNAALGVDIHLLYLDCYRSKNGKYVVKCGRDAHQEEQADEASAAERLVQFAHIWHHGLYWQDPQLKYNDPKRGVHYKRIDSDG